MVGCVAVAGALLFPVIHNLFAYLIIFFVLFAAVGAVVDGDALFCICIHFNLLVCWFVCHCRSYAN